MKSWINISLVADVYVGDDGKLHKVIGGADTVLPFKSKSPIKLSTGIIYGVIGSLSDLRTLLSIDVSNYSKITSGTFTKAHYGYVYLYGDSTILKSITSRNGSQSINLSGIDISKYKNLRFVATNDSSVANASITNLVIE